MTSRNLTIEGLTVLKEVFNRPYRLDRSSSYDGDQYTAYTDDGREIYIDIDFVDADMSFQKGFGAFNPDIAKRYKWNPNQVVGRVYFEVDGYVGVSGQGDASRIFATAIEAINMSMKRNKNLVGFMFEGVGDSRSRLYITMIRRLSRKFGLVPVVIKDMEGTTKDLHSMFAFLGHQRRAPWMFVDEVKEDIAINNIKEDYKVDYGGATPFNNAFRRYMSDFYPPDQDNEGYRMHDVMGAMLGHKLGLIGTEDIEKLQKTYNEREREAGRKQDRDQYLNPVYQQRMRDIYTGKISPGELGTVPGGEGTLANKAYNDALRRGTNKDRMKDLAKSLLAKRPRSSLKPGIQEDIGPKTSKQSIRPYVRNAVRGLRK